MPSTYTTRLRLTLPATGELNNTWGNTVNSGITELLDAAIAGTATISTWGGAGVAYTLSNNNGVADEARCMFIVASGAPGEAKNIICPNVSKLYVVTNSVSGGFSVTLKTAAGTGISVENGKTAILRCDGTNVVNAITQLPSFVVAGGTPNQVQFLNASRELTGSANMTFDGTTLSVAALADASLTSGRVTYATTGGNLTDSANLTFDGTSLTLGGNPTLTAGTANGVLYLNGSKVATSGSALTFDGTNFATTGTSSATKLVPTGNVTAGNGMYLPTTNELAWSVNGAEGMRLTSTGLGIGTSALRGNLDVGTLTATSVTRSIHLGYSAIDFYGYRLQNTNNAGSTAAGTFSIQRGNTSAWVDVLTSDDNGNVGIGTTPGQRLAVRSADNSGATNIARFESNNAAQGVVVRFASVLGDGGTTSFGTLTNNAVVFAVNNNEVARFDTSGNFGIGTSSPGARLDVSGADGVRARVVATSGGTSGLILSSAGNTAYTIKAGNADNSLRIDQDGSDRITLASGGNLGIGTSSPAHRLHVATAGNSYIVSQRTTAITSALLLGAESGTTAIYSWTTPGGSTGVPLNFYTGPSVAMTLDASGNLGLGVTPSAWSGVIALQLQTGASLTGFSNTTNLVQNAYFNGSWRYISTAAAALSQVTQGEHYWFTAPSGTAGNTISFTQAMTLDASGNLLVGTTGSIGRFTSYSTSGYRVVAAGASYAVGLTDTALVFGNNTLGSYSDGFYDGASHSFKISGVEKARITSGGQLVLNSGATGNQLQFWDTGAVAERARLGINASNGLDFAVGSTTPRMTITSTGNVVAGGSVALATTATDGFLYVPTCAGTPTGTPTAITGMAPIVVNTTNNKLYFYSGGAWRDAGP